MSSSGIQAVSSGPLIIRTYNDTSSSDVTYVLQDYDYPVPSNYVLITSTNGQLMPSDNIYVSSVTTSSFNVDYGRFSTIFISSCFGFSPVNFYSPIRINNTNPPTDGPQLFVNGSTVFTEPGAQTEPTNAGVTIWGLPNGNTINSSFTTSTLYTINDPVTKIHFQLIGSGGSNIYGSGQPNIDLPGIGTYIAGTLSVKQGDKLQIFTGTVGDANNGSKGTSLIYLSSIGGGTYISTIVCIAGAGGGNGWAPLNISSSSGGGHGGGDGGRVTTSGNIDFIRAGTGGYDAISTLTNGNYQTFADGGQGGQLTSGGNGGGNGGNGDPANTTNLLISGGLTNGGVGGNGTRIGGYGGGGYTGGGGGQGSIVVSAGGGGGATYIATSTLSGYLSNLVCLGGQWISQNNATPFGQDYGLPGNPGYVTITGYEPNDTLYTNGDIDCRVLRYEMLDPPINVIGGASALWATYPAIDIVNMNDNQIVECGGIHIDNGGINVKNFVDIRAGNNDLLSTNVGFMSQFIRTASSGTYTVDYQVASDSTNFGAGNNWQDARYVYNSANIPNTLAQVWGIVTSSNITNVGPKMGDIRFYNSLYVNGYVGIGTTNPTTNLQIVGTTSTNNLVVSSITTNQPSLNIVANTTVTSGNLSITSGNLTATAGTTTLGTLNTGNTTVTSGNLSITSGNLTATAGTTTLGTLNTGNTTVTSGNLSITSGNLTATAGTTILGTLNANTTTLGTLNTGNTTVTSGNLSITSGNLSITSGNLTATTGITTLGTLNTGNTTVTSGNLSITSGNLTATSGITTLGTLNTGNTTVTSGNLSITSGNLTATAGTTTLGTLNTGNTTVTSGNLSITSGNLTAAAGTTTLGTLNTGTTTVTSGNLSITSGNLTATAGTTTLGTLNAGTTIVTSGNLTVNTGDINVSVGNIYAQGNITAGSDIRFKTNITKLINSLSTVKSLTGVSYNMVNNKNDSRQIGLIAQDVERVLPEVVFTDTSSEQFKSVSYGNIVAILIEAIKELSDKVDTLEKLIHTTK
jgi:hypothetical protein